MNDHWRGRGSTLYEILNSFWLETRAGGTIELAPTVPVRPAGIRAASLFQADDTTRVYLVDDPIGARLVQPSAAYCEAGGADGTDRRYRVIESVLVDTEHGGDPIDPVPADGAERNAIAYRH